MWDGLARLLSLDHTFSLRRVKAMDDQRRASPTPKLVAAVATTGAVLTVSAAVAPVTGFAGRSPALHVAIDTAVSIIALLACSLLLGRFRENRTLADLLLVTAFLTLSLTNLCFSTMPAVVGASADQFTTWSSAAGRLFGALALAAAALCPPRCLAAPRRATLYAFGGCAALLGVIGAAVALLGDVLPAGVRPAPSTVRATGPELVGNPVFLAMQLLAAMGFVSATIGFSRRALRMRDQLMYWVAGAAALSASAFLSYFFFPTLYSDWVSIGDILRAAAYVFLLLGAFGEIGIYRRQAAASAQLEERERIARDLHDGLAQELAFLTGRLRELAAKPDLVGGGKTLMPMLASAAQRALDESRVAVSSLAGPGVLPLEMAVEHAAEEVAAREGGRVLVEAEPGLEVSPGAYRALLRIVREAVGNAVRHGEPSNVEVTLAANDGVVLEVKDDGRGFAGGRPGGLGLESMRQRAAGCGGHAAIVSTLGQGTVVTVHLPREVLEESTDRWRFPARGSTRDGRADRAGGVQSLNEEYQSGYCGHLAKVRG